MKHYIIGSCPPPIGGITVYIYRYSRQLQAEGKEVEVVDLVKRSTLGKLRALLGMALSPKLAAYELNCYSFYAMVVLILRPFPGKIVFYHHGHGILDQIGPVKRIIFRKFLKKIDTCVYVGAHLPEHYRKLGFLPREDKIRVQPAFLPPPPDDELRIIQTYDDAILRFVDQHDPLIIANAFKLMFHEGTELYGLDMCIDLMAEIKKEYPQAGLFFALAEIGDQDYYKAMQHRINELGLSYSFYFMTGQRELWPLFKKADLMVRPTCVDGYGISIAEALYFGCPAVASDVCPRAEGTMLFANRDTGDFIEKCREVLRRHSSIK